MRTLLILSIISLSAVACVSKQKVLDANWVSMKYSEFPDETKLTRVAPIETKYCMNSWSGSYGLIDEATKQAESKFQIDYIKNPSFVKEGDTCMTVTGEGYRRNSQ